MKSFGKWPSRAALIAVAIIVPASRGASPRDELLRLVPKDSGFCLVIQGLREQAPAFLNSPFFLELQKSPLFQAIRQGEDAEHFVACQKQLLGDLQTSWKELIDEILGDAIVVSYKPGPLGHDDEEQGLLLIRARNAELLARLLQRINEVQGDVKIEPLTHGGAAYTQRTDDKGKHFFYLHDVLLVISPNENALKQVIDRDLAPADRAPPPIASSLRRLGADKALAALWINPRAFESRMEVHAHAKDIDVLVQRAILTYWKALEGIAITLSTHHDDAELRLTFGTEPKRLPAPAQKFLAAETLRADVWSRFPERAIFSVAGRLDAGGWDDFLATFMEPAAREQLRERVNRRAGAALGNDPVHSILPYLGPDWGFCVSAPAGGQPSWFPHVLAVLKIRPSPDNPPVDQSLVNMMKALAGLMVFAYNSDHADELSLHNGTDGAAQFTYLQNDRKFPPGLRPAFGLKDGYLVVASSPEAIADFRARSSGKAKVSPDSVDAVSRRVPEIPLVQLSLDQLRLFINERIDALAAHMAEKEGITPAEARKRLTALGETLHVFRAVELGQQFAPDQISLVLRVRSALALEK